MKAIILQNTVYGGRFRSAGEEIELPDDVAKKFCDAGLAHCDAVPVEEIKIPEFPELPDLPVEAFGLKVPSKKRGRPPKK